MSKSPPNKYDYGMLSDIDVITLEKSLDVLISTFKKSHLIILEIGMYYGNTINAIKKRLDSLQVDAEYWSVDTGTDLTKQEHPFKDCKIIIGDSSEVFVYAPDNLHWVFVDGCHCINHVMLDFIHYGNKLIDGGIIVFHDSSPVCQGRSYCGHGPKRFQPFNVAVLEAFKQINIMNNKNFTLLFEDYDPQKKFGGITVFQKKSTVITDCIIK